MPYKVEVAGINGPPSLLFDGKPVSPVAVYIPRIDKAEIRRFAGTGIHLYTFPVKPGDDEKFILTDKMSADLTDADPHACFFPRVNVEPSARWLKEHGENIVIDNFGRNYNLRASFASSPWIDKMGPVFADFVRHMEKVWGARIIGYHIAAGLCGEWFWGCGENIDFSRAGIEGFRMWVKSRYCYIEKLNKRWSAAYSNFSQITVPSVEERIQADLHGFRDPRRRQSVIDYYLFIQETTADRIVHFAKIAKKETGGKKITGVFYGYTNDITGYWEANQLQGCGHSAMSKVLRCKEVDFLTSPFNYYDRNTGGSDWAHGAIDSILLHGKFFYCEADTRTALTEAENPAFRDLKVPTIKDSIEVLKRNFAYAMAKSSGIWWMELTGKGWFNDKQILKTLGLTQKIYGRNAGRTGQSVAEIAVMLDEKSPLFLSETSHALHSSVFYQAAQLSKIGAPYDIYLLDDLENIRDYKLYLFLDTLNINKEQTNIIHKKLQANKGTAVWLYSPGIIDGKKISIKNMETLTGIKINYLDAETSIKIRITDNSHPLTRGIEKDFLFGGEASAPSNRGFQVQHPNLPLNPVFYACDGEIKVLGIINAGNKPGFVLKETGKWDSIYCSAGAIPAVLIRNIAGYAGVHIFNDCNDVLYANSNWLAVHARTEGIKTIKLPEKARVEDAFSGKTVSGNKTRIFTFKAKKHCTYLFQLNPYPPYQDRNALRMKENDK